MSQKPPSDREEEEIGEEKESAISHARAYTAPGVTVYYDRGRWCDAVRAGALHHRLGKRSPEEPEQPTRIEFVANGPINLRGDLSIEVPGEGRMREVRASLCRCGLTENEPFCDKACSRSGWRSEVPTRTND